MNARYQDRVSVSAGSGLRRCDPNVARTAHCRERWGPSLPHTHMCGPARVGRAAPTSRLPRGSGSDFQQVSTGKPVGASGRLYAFTPAGPPSGKVAVSAITSHSSQPGTPLAWQASSPHGRCFAPFSGRCGYRERPRRCLPWWTPRSALRRSAHELHERQI